MTADYFANLTEELEREFPPDVAPIHVNEPCRLPGACDPRNLDYLIGIASRLADLTAKIDAEQGRRSRLNQRRQAFRAKLDELELGARIAIAEEVTDELDKAGKPKARYTNEFAREAALAEWRMGEPEASGQLEEIEGIEQEMDLVNGGLDRLAMDRVNLLSESRLAAAWLQFASTEGTAER